MSKTAGSHSHTWLSLVEISGLLVTEPVLEDHFSSGPPPVDPSLHRRLGRQHDRFMARADGENARGALRKWSRFVLHELLGIQQSLWYRHPDVPAQTMCTLREYRQQLKPTAAMLDEEETVRLLLWECDPGQGLDEVEKETGRWRASPFHKFDRLLREVDVPVGILTNGHQWRLIYAAPGESTSHITWTAETWREEKHTLDAFCMLAGRERFFGPEGDRLPALIEESQERQTKVTDQLGEQVRDAVETFVRALDAADRETGAELLSEMSLPDIYEMSLTVMMRLVFLLYAEENHLLPHGEVAGGILGADPGRAPAHDPHAAVRGEDGRHRRADADAGGPGGDAHPRQTFRGRPLRLRRGQLEKSDLHVPQAQLSRDGWRMEDPRVERLKEKIIGPTSTARRPPRDIDTTPDRG
jgi:hypothetical protein